MRFNAPEPSDTVESQDCGFHLDEDEREEDAFVVADETDDDADAFTNEDTADEDAELPADCGICRPV